MNDKQRLREALIVLGISAALSPLVYFLRDFHRDGALGLWLAIVFWAQLTGATLMVGGRWLRPRLAGWTAPLRFLTMLAYVMGGLYGFGWLYLNYVVYLASRPVVWR